MWLATLTDIFELCDSGKDLLHDAKDLEKETEAFNVGLSGQP